MTIEIDRAPDDIWPFLVEPEQIMLWNTDIVSNEPLTGDLEGVGARSLVGIMEGGKTVEYECEVKAFEQSRYLEIELRGGSLGKNPMAVGYRLSPTASGTLLHFTGDWKPSGILLRLMVPLIRFAGKRNGQRVMQRLKDLAESSFSAKP